MELIGAGLQSSNILGEWVDISKTGQHIFKHLKCWNFDFLGNLLQDTRTCFERLLLQWNHIWHHNSPPHLWECESLLKEWWTCHHQWHEAGKSRSQASTLSTGSGTVYKGLTYISRMLQLLSLSMEGINPHEGERHIQALVTGWHLAEDWTPRPCPPH